MDKTGLYWRAIILIGLFTQLVPSRKKDKSRISIILCINCIGIDHVPLWFLRHVKHPRALRSVNINVLGGY